VEARYGELYMHRGEIEARFGGELSWDVVESRRAARIATYGSGAVEQVGRHEEFVDWFLTNLERLRAALDPYA